MTKNNFMQGNLLQAKRAYARALQKSLLDAGLLNNRFAGAIDTPRYIALCLQLGNSNDLTKALDIGEKVAYNCKVESVRVNRIKGLVVYQIGLPEMLWSNVKSDGLSGMGIGVNSLRKNVRFSFDEPHTGVFGATGSGKSEAIKTTIYKIAKNTKPDNTKLLMLDPHHDLEKFENIQHLIRPVAHTVEDIQNSLDYILQLHLKRQSENLRNDFRLVIVCDEVSDILEIDNKNVLSLIAAKDRKFKINLIIGSQQATKEHLGNIPANLSQKLVGHVQSARESLYVTGYPAMQAHRLTGKGDFLAINPNHFTRFQVGLTSEVEIDKLPRGEIATLPEIEFDAVNVPEIIESEENRGRPKEELKGDIVVGYLAVMKSGDDVTIAQGNEWFDIGRYTHNRYKKLVREMLDEMKFRNLKLLKAGGE